MRDSDLEDDERRTIFKPSAKIGPISPFVRIDTIFIDCLKTCVVQLLPLLRQFSSAIYHPYVCIGINVETPARFLSYLSDKIVPLFDGCKPQFEFQMHFDEPRNTMPVINSILQFPQVKASVCTRLLVTEELIEDDMQHSLQIDVISDWLHQQVHQPSFPYYRTLEIEILSDFDVEDDEEMLPVVVRLESVERLIDTLKMVCLNILFILSFPAFYSESENRIEITEKDSLITGLYF